MRYSDESKKLMLNVVSYFQNELGSRFKAIQKASEALRVPQSTLYNLEDPNRATDFEFRRNMSANVSRSKIRITKNILHSLREVIYKMYARKDHITLETIYRQYKEESPEIRISKTSLYLGIKKMGFSFKKQDGRKHLLEMPGIRLKRILFLNKYQIAKKENIYKPVFLDETWVFSKSGDRRMWQDGSKYSSFKKTGNGIRYVIVHAGNKDGFVKNASLIFKCNKKTGDYHDNMNTANFEKWFKYKLIANLEEPSLIILDNATYHSRLEEEIPRKSWSIKRLLDWLGKKNISFPNNILKDGLESCGKAISIGKNLSFGQIRRGAWSLCSQATTLSLSF